MDVCLLARRMPRLPGTHFYISHVISFLNCRISHTALYLYSPIILQQRRTVNVMTIAIVKLYNYFATQ